MNLSHVERYFADFLSHMETPDTPLVLNGYTNDSDVGKLKYPNNIFVIGTVNIDETTYMFSPKVLDRANVIEFKPDKNDVMDSFFSENQANNIIPARPGVAEAFLRLAFDIQNGRCNVEENQLTIAQDFFTKVYEVLEKNGFEFAYRTVKEIKRYLCASREIIANWNDDELYRSIDEQFTQKVLPKIHGNRKQITTLLDELETLCIQDNHELELSKRKIEQMKGKLVATQYASYI